MSLQGDVLDKASNDDLPERANQLLTDLIIVAVADDGTSLLPLDLDSANTAIDIALEYVIKYEQNIHWYCN